MHVGEVFVGVSKDDAEKMIQELSEKKATEIDGLEVCGCASLLETIVLDVS